jgi:hypothetical protein
MAELSASDKRVLLGPDYKEPEVSAATVADQSRRKWRNLAIGLITLAAVVVLAVLFGSQGIVR